MALLRSRENAAPNATYGYGDKNAKPGETRFKLTDGNKSYVVDGCMVMLTTQPAGYKDWHDDLKRGTREMCVRMIENVAQAESAAKVAEFGPDDSTTRIAKAMDNDSTLRPRLNAWLKEKGIDVSTTSLLYGSEHSSLREQAIAELSIK